MGACCQSLLFLVLPTRYALTAATVMLGLRFLNKSLIALGVLHNPAMDGVILKKTTAQVRDKDGNYSANGASGEKIVVLLLGFKSNHPFGVFAPGFKEMGDYFNRMSVELSEGAADNGCTYLSISRGRGRFCRSRVKLCNTDTNSTPQSSAKPPGQAKTALRAPNSSTSATGATSNPSTPSLTAPCIARRGTTGTVPSSSTTSSASTTRSTRPTPSIGKMCMRISSPRDWVRRVI
jgi:hypothetical protein